MSKSSFQAKMYSGVNHLSYINLGHDRLCLDDFTWYLTNIRCYHTDLL